MPSNMTIGEKLYLRVLDISDAPALTRAIDESRSHLVPFLPFATNDPADEDFRRSWIGRCQEEFLAGVRFQYGIVQGDEIIGGCSIDPVTERMASLGFWIHAKHTRQGIATAVAGVLRDAALDAGYDTVRIRHDRANTASGAIADRLGFQWVGEEDHSIDAPGQTGTSVVWHFRRPH